MLFVGLISVRLDLIDPYKARDQPFYLYSTLLF